MSIITLNNVSKKIKSKQVLSNVTMEINKNDIVTFEGINGSGKTLLIKAILGLIKTDGEIKMKSTTVTIENPLPISAGILIEAPSLIEQFTAFKNIELISSLILGVTSDDILGILNRFDLLESSDQKVKTFSLGMKQKLGIAQAFIGYNELIVLDEPTNALDTESINHLVQIIQEYNQKGCTFIIASHDHNFIERVSTRRFIVQKGHAYEE